MPKSDLLQLGPNVLFLLKDAHPLLPELPESLFIVFEGWANSRHHCLHIILLLLQLFLYLYYLGILSLLPDQLYLLLQIWHPQSTGGLRFCLNLCLGTLQNLCLWFDRHCSRHCWCRGIRWIIYSDGLVCGAFFHNFGPLYERLHGLLSHCFKFGLKLLLFLPKPSNFGLHG